MRDIHLAGMDRRRSSMDPGSNQAPPKKIVGFHVEGVNPSPVHHSGLLADNELQGGHITGSPNPVIIPPSFQVCGHHNSAMQRPMLQP